MAIRTLEEQFGKRHAGRARRLRSRIQNLAILAPGMHLHRYELDQCIEAGLALSSLMLTSSLVESNLRELLVRSDNRNEAEDVYEESTKPRWVHSRLVDEAVSRSLLTASQGERFKDFYASVRIPLHHGLPKRTAKKLGDTSMEEMFGHHGRDHRIENAFEDSWITLLGQATELLEIIDASQCKIEANTASHGTAPRRP